MASDTPEADDGPASDPFEAELVAYLDGELDPVAARKVEARLAQDPAARARAAELKKSFDMLDYLPKPEPSPTFTSRTLDKLPSVNQPATRSTGPGSQTPSPAADRAGGAKTAVPPGASTSMPLPLDEDEPPPTQRPARARPRPLLWAALLVVAVSGFAAVGYFASAAVRPHLFPVRDKEPDDAKLAPDARVLEHLPLYAAADDLAFVVELAKPELFGDDPAVAFDSTLKIPPTDTGDKPSGKEFDVLAKAFRALPTTRQAEIVKLDQELHTTEPKERDRLFRALEAYTVWLERLPEPERRAVMSAATAHLRLGVIRDVRDRQWLDTLPPALRGKPELIQQWRDEEALRRDRWAFVRQHAQAFAANKSPWPFDTDAGKASVLEYARDILKVDDPKRCRLSPEELAEYQRTLAVAQRDSAWAWYGLLVYEYANAHPYLPEPQDPKLRFDEFSDLPDPLARILKKGMSFKLRAANGKWPEFPLEFQREVQNATKFPFGPPLGPGRLKDFKEPVRTFAEQELFPKMAGDERRDLQRQEGKWPDYGRELVRYAHKYDLAVPGVSLPGSPRKWDATYGLRPGTRPPN